jgi:hypothetical protein
MWYNRVFTETLRKYPVAPFLDRISCSDYQLPAANGNGTVTLPAGTSVYIPVLALHHDPTYYPEPEKFDPDRFTEENKLSRPNYTYIPCGEGQRICIGKDRHLIAHASVVGFRVPKVSNYVQLPGQFLCGRHKMVFSSSKTIRMFADVLLQQLMPATNYINMLT